MQLIVGNGRMTGQGMKSRVEMAVDFANAGPPAARSGDPVVRFFDARARHYDREYQDETPAGYALRIRREKVMRLFDQPGGRVLDVGCGPGIMAAETVQRGCEFWGVDPSSQMISICRDRFAGERRAQFIVGDAVSLPLANGFFDAVICMGVIDALRDRPRAVREMLRVLKPGGTLLLTFTNSRSPYSRWKKDVFYPLVSKYHALKARMEGSSAASVMQLGGSTRTLYSERAARRLVESLGAVVTEIAPYHFNLFLSPLDEIMPRLALAAARGLEHSADSLPGWMAFGFIVKAQKTSEAGGSAA
jgi:ubiquinone/menaquinone biosynthesis C-methylase UbiE